MKLIPRLKPYYSKEELFSSINISKGNILKYEQEFAKKFGCDYGTMFSYGRTALYSLFKVWELDNTEIICPAYTCVVVPHAIVLSNNTPVFVDCEEGSFNMSYEKIKSSITEKTRAIIVTHLFGIPMNVNLIQNIVEEAEKKYQHKIYVIQDVAHSFGAKWEGHLVTKFGDASIFGLNISKIINSIFGGMVITKNKELHEKLTEYKAKHLKKPSWLKSIKRFIYLIATYIAFSKYIYFFINKLEEWGTLGSLVKYYDESIIDFPKDWDINPTEIEARVGLVQLKKYDEIIDSKKKIADYYFTQIKNVKNIELLHPIDGTTYSHFVALVEDRDEFVRNFRRNNVQLGILIEYSIPYMQSYKKYRKEDYPISKYYAEHTINFPIWSNLSTDQITF